MFTAALFIIANTWKQSQCLWTEDRIKRMWCVRARVCVCVCACTRTLCRWTEDRIKRMWCVYAHAWAHAHVRLVSKSCLTLCNPADCSPPGCSVHGNSPGKNTGVGFHALSKPGIEPRSPALQGDSSLTEPPGKPKNTGVGGLSLLQGNFPPQESKLGFPALQADSLPAEPPSKPNVIHTYNKQNEIMPFAVT